MSWRELRENLLALGDETNVREERINRTAQMKKHTDELQYMAECIHKRGWETLHTSAKLAARCCQWGGGEAVANKHELRNVACKGCLENSARRHTLQSEPKGLSFHRSQHIFSTRTTARWISKFNMQLHKEPNSSKRIQGPRKQSTNRYSPLQLATPQKSSHNPKTILEGSTRTDMMCLGI